MSDPQPTEPRPQLLANTPENTPAAQRPSTWAGIATMLLDWSALAGVVAALLNPTHPDVRLLVLAAVLKTLGSNVSVIQTWYVRMGVTNLDRKTETLAARTERELQKPAAVVVVPPIDDTFPPLDPSITPREHQQ